MAAGEAASSAALDVLAEALAPTSSKQNGTLTTIGVRQLHALSDQLPAIRTEFVTKESRLREVEQQRAALSDHCGLLTQENRRAADED